MARPNSKYFASVITKLIASKRQEKIVIDESFKMQLRSKLLTHAAGGAGQADAPVFGEFLKRWRYAFALVPSALVVMIVAAQFLNMPVSIPSEQVTEVSTEQSTIETQEDEGKGEEVLPDEQLSLSEEEPFVPEIAVMETTQPVKKLKTFPGALVMPPASTQSDLPEPVVIQPAYEAQQGMAIQPAEETAEPVAASTPVVPQQTSQPTPSLSLFGLNIQVTPYDETVPAYREERTTKEVTEKEEPSAAKVTQVQEPAALEPVIAQKVLPVNEQTALSTSSSPVIPAQEVTRIEAGTRIQAGEVLDGIVVRPASQTSIRYEVDLDPVQQEKLEQRVIAGLTDNNPAEVIVSRQQDSVISVSVMFKDGKNIKRSYKYNRGTGVWDTVEFVTNYYFDDSLSYTTNFVYSVR